MAFCGIFRLRFVVSLLGRNESAVGLQTLRVVNYNHVRQQKWVGGRADFSRLRLELNNFFYDVTLCYFVLFTVTLCYLVFVSFSTTTADWIGGRWCRFPVRLGSSVVEVWLKLQRSRNGSSPVMFGARAGAIRARAGQQFSGPLPYPCETGFNLQPV